MEPAAYSQVMWDRSPGTIYNELRLRGEHCDVVIRAGGVEFKAHKVILCGCSPYFRALFSGRWYPAHKAVYEIPAISASMMRLIIDYAYVGTVPVTAQNAEQLLIAADYLSVTGIVRLCGHFLRCHLSLGNCISMWKFAGTYHCPELREAAHLYIVEHFEEVTRSSAEFLELSVHELNYLIETDGLNVSQEDIVFGAILKWVAHDPESRRRYICHCLMAAGD